jgi:ABC-type polysaccharide/polyol phosphate export permease
VTVVECIILVGLAWIGMMATRRLISQTHFVYLVPISIVIIASLVLVSPERTLIFGSNTLISGLCLLLYPDHVRKQNHFRKSLVHALSDLKQYRALMLLWLRYRLETRYAQAILGILWVILLPLSTSLVLAIAFTQLSGRSTIVNDVPYVAFLLAGSSLFQICRNIILQARQSLLSMMSVISRVYFPREILILVMVGEVLVDFSVVFIAMLGINALFFHIYPNIYYIYLPVIVLIMVGFSVGVALLVSWYGLLISDLQQLLTIIMKLLFFLTVLFARSDASSLATTIIHVNPLALLVEAFRDVVLYARAPDMLNLAFPAVVALMLLYIGYTTFKANEDRIVEVM